MPNYRDQKKKKIFFDGLKIPIMVCLCVRTQTHTKTNSTHPFKPSTGRREEAGKTEGSINFSCLLRKKGQKMADILVIPMLSSLVGTVMSPAPSREFQLWLASLPKPPPPWSSLTLHIGVCGAQFLEDKLFNSRGFIFLTSTVLCT